MKQKSLARAQCEHAVRQVRKQIKRTLPYRTERLKNLRWQLKQAEAQLTAVILTES